MDLNLARERGLWPFPWHLLRTMTRIRVGLQSLILIDLQFLAALRFRLWSSQQAHKTQQNENIVYQVYVRIGREATKLPQS
jgi:hypothetical protein